MSSKGGARVLRVLAAVVVSTVVIVALATQIDVERAGELLADANLIWLGAAAIGTASLVAVRGLRFYLVFPGASLATTSAAIGAQTIINRIAPMRLGELSLPYLLRKAAGADAARSLITLVLIRFVEAAASVALLLTAMALRGSFESLRWTAPLVALLAIVLVALVRFRQTIAFGARVAGWIARASRLERFGPIQRAIASLARAASGAETLSVAARAQVFALSVIALALQIAVFAAILAAFSIEVGWLALVQASCVTFVGSIVPLPTVGTIGTLEATWAAGFVWVGLELDVAVFTGIATQVITLLISAVLSVPCWMILARAAAGRR